MADHSRILLSGMLADSDKTAAGNIAGRFGKP